LSALVHRVAGLEQAYISVTETNKEINESLKSLVRLEEKHTAVNDRLTLAIATLASVDKRLQAMENRRDFWDRSANAIWAGLVGIAILAGVYVWNTTQVINAQRQALDQYRTQLIQGQVPR
jgi:hypothetical protein